VTGDMSLNETTDDKELFFEWSEVIPFSVVIFMCMGAISYFLKIRVNIYGTAAASMGVVILHATIWNTIHTKMHHRDIETDFPKVWVPDPFYNEWEHNHTMHHQIKSEKKGNYNVVFLGFDELLESNNKILE
jgi:hypothetical protein